MQNSQSSFSAEFASKYRLLRKDGFDRAVKAESIADGRFKVFFVRNGKNNARLGIIASKKVIPHATDRNQIKRAIREAFRQHGAKFCKLDMVVMVRHAYTQNTGKLGDNLKTLFSLVENRCAES